MGSYSDPHSNQRRALIGIYSIAYSFSVYMYRFHIWSDTDIFKSSSGTLLAYVKLFVCLFVCVFDGAYNIIISYLNSQLLIWTNSIKSLTDSAKLVPPHGVLMCNTNSSIRNH